MRLWPVQGRIRMLGAMSVHRLLRPLAVATAVCLFAAGCVIGGTSRPERTPFPTLPPTPPVSLAPSAAAPLLPDLAYEPMVEFYTTQDAEGKRAIRFTGSIKNIGEGPLIIHAERPSPDTDAWTVTQRFADGMGGLVENPTDATLVYGGHGHDHWHVFAETSYELYDLESGKLASRRKAGFCYFDQVRLPEAGSLSPEQMVYRPERCGKPGDVWIEMGMSVGWSDPYHWSLEDQDLDITGLPDGRYRIVGIADPDGWFTELDETNNSTEVIVELKTDADGFPTIALVPE